MNKYVAIANSFCDACVNARTCKGTCKRVSNMIKLAERYEKVCLAFDKSCVDISIGYIGMSGLPKDAVKDFYLNDDK